MLIKIWILLTIYCSQMIRFYYLNVSLHQLVWCNNHITLSCGFLYHGNQAIVFCFFCHLYCSIIVVVDCFNHPSHRYVLVFLVSSRLSRSSPRPPLSLMYFLCRGSARSRTSSVSTNAISDLDAICCAGLLSGACR